MPIKINNQDVRIINGDRRILSVMQGTQVVYGEEQYNPVFTFSIQNNEATVTGLTEYGRQFSKLYIPSFEKKYPVTSIGESAFINCSRFTSIDIPNSVTSIGRDVFYGCKGLTSITIPSSVTSIESGLFWDCTGLTSITIPNSVTSIGYNTFNGCTGLTSITLPFVGGTLNGTTNTEFAYIFGGNVPASLKTVVMTGGTSIGGSAFSGCSGLTSITIPDSVLNIAESAFEGCSGLYSITLPFLGRTRLPRYLRTVVMTGGTSIRAGAFDSFIGLDSITIPNSVTSIGEYAFRSCIELFSITIPASVTEMGGYVFDDCRSMHLIYCEAERKPIGWVDYWDAKCKATVVWGYTGA